MRRVHWLLVMTLAAVLVGPAYAQSARPTGALAEGIDHYLAGRYEQAITSFGTLARSASDNAQKPAATFWLAKAQLAVGRIDEAAQGLANYLATWPTDVDRAEAVYLQGRVLHQQEDFEAAIRTFQSFLSAYPTSVFTANAWFWSAESLYGLGRLEEAAILYQKIIREYPTSAKVEAAQYKASLIGLTQREQELSRLLKWSHEEFLRTVEQYQRRQDASDQALAALQKRLAAAGGQSTPAVAAPAAITAEGAATAEQALADLRTELAAKTAESATMAGRVTDLETQLAALKAASADAEAGTAESSDVYEQALADLRAELEAKIAQTAALEARLGDLEQQLQGAEETARLLAAKAEALALKELLLGWLQEQGGTP